MELITQKNRTEAERLRAYRQRNPEGYRRRNAARMRKSRAAAIPQFVGVDTEGIGQGKNHRAVLISAYDKEGKGESYTARNVRKGLQWDEVFAFLYGQFQRNPKAAFVGFYLSYDFNNWLCHRAGLPEKAARQLLTKAGRAARKSTNPQPGKTHEAVKVGRWEVDVLAFKRLAIRPRPEGCFCYEQAQKCEHDRLPWLYVCDTGTFFQSSFLSTIDPKKWKDDPGGPVCTPEEYAAILEGKNYRPKANRVDAKMVYYNKLENMVLARVMERLAVGYLSIGIKLRNSQWYGPGASAAKWLSQNGGIKREKLTRKDGKLKRIVPADFWRAAQASYFGGWFEIFSHGIIEGDSYNYDINSAYPYAITTLPHICRESRWGRGNGAYNGHGNYVLVYATVFSKGDRIGAMPHRRSDGTILRPTVTKGWYWKFEIDAARKAGLVKRTITHEWVEYIPCSHPNPYTKIGELYNLRLEKGKNGALGMAIKLTINSVYGKFAQIVGTAPYNNWFYASYITSHCRTKILGAIATHPGKADSVLMVATDGICFDSPHPGIPISDTTLGEWTETTYHDLLLFKPGVYTHAEGMDALRALKVKSRGVPRDEFAKAVGQAEAEFRRLLEEKRPPGFEYEDVLAMYPEEDNPFVIGHLMRGWPKFKVPIRFRMKSCRQALNENKWDSSAMVMENVELMQDSDPRSKRNKTWFNHEKGRIDTNIHDLRNMYPPQDIQTKYHGEVEFPKDGKLGFSFDGSPLDGILEAAAIARDKPANYDLPIEEEYEWEQVW